MTRTLSKSQHRALASTPAALAVRCAHSAVAFGTLALRMDLAGMTPIGDHLRKARTELNAASAKLNHAAVEAKRQEARS